jgi:hypothetical protein
MILEQDCKVCIAIIGKDGPDDGFVFHPLGYDVEIQSEVSKEERRLRRKDDFLDDPSATPPIPIKKSENRRRFSAQK